MSEVLRIVGGIAGIGGISLGILLLVYRDMVRDLIRQRAFRSLSAEQATVLLGATVVFTFVVAILGIFAGLASGGGARPFIVLVCILLVFVLALLVIAGRVLRGRGSPEAVQRKPFERVAELVAAGRLDEAERELERGDDADRSGPGFWYWKSRIALVRENVPGALGYAEEAVKRDPADEASVALKVKLLILSSKRGDRAKAKRLAEESRALSEAMDVWVGLLTAEGMFAPGIRSNAELDAKCPFPRAARRAP